MPIATQNELTASAGPGLLIDSPNRFISPHVAGTNVRGLAAKTPVSKTGRTQVQVLPGVQVSDHRMVVGFRGRGDGRGLVHGVVL